MHVANGDGGLALLAVGCALHAIPIVPQRAYLDASGVSAIRRLTRDGRRERLYPLRVRQVFRFLLNSFSISFMMGCTGRCQ